MYALIYLFRIGSLALFLLAVGCISGCSDSDRARLYQQQVFTFGTLVDISIWSAQPDLAQLSIQSVSQHLARLHKAWNPWKPGELHTLNQHSNIQTPLSVSADIVELIKQSQTLYRHSEGLFNPAIGRLIKVWQFDVYDDIQHTFTLPAAEDIQNIVLQNPNMMDIQLSEHQVVITNPAVQLDFGAYAKGVALNQAILKLKQMGIENALVNAGGDLKVIGKKNQKDWHIGIKNPDKNSGQAVIAAVDLKPEESIFTSGNYERFYEWQNKRYHHIIDPRNGYPANACRSVTVITQDAALADAAATALFIAGPTLWLRIAKQMQVEKILLVAQDGSIFLTKAMADRVKLLVDSPLTIVSFND